MTREVLPYLRAQGSGRIVNIGSVLGFLPAPYGAFYAASKHAVEGYSESLDHETREFGVRVTVVEPGYTSTSFEANATDADSPIGSYAPIREHVKDVLAQSVRAGDDPAVVAQVVLKAATSRTPKLRYPAGPLARRLSLLKKLAPDWIAGQGNSQSQQVGYESQAGAGRKSRGESGHIKGVTLDRHDALLYRRTKSFSLNTFACSEPLSSRPKNVHRRGADWGVLINLTCVAQASFAQRPDGVADADLRRVDLRCVAPILYGHCFLYGFPTTVPAIGRDHCLMPSSEVPGLPNNRWWRTVESEPFRCQR